MRSHAGARISRSGVDGETGGGQKNVYFFIVFPLMVHWIKNRNTLHTAKDYVESWLHSFVEVRLNKLLRFRQVFV